MYDLRYDPTPFVSLPAKELAKRMAWQPRSVEREPFPVKALRYNRCPAIAPNSVLDTASRERLHLDMQAVEKHRRILEENPEFATRVSEAYAAQDTKPEQSSLMGSEHRVDGQLYDGFLSNEDKKQLGRVRSAAPQELSSLAGSFRDDRLNTLLPLYKARNYPEALTSDERAAWEKFCTARLLDGGPKSRLAKYFGRLEALAKTTLTPEQQYLVEELKLYGESIMPSEQ